MSIDLNGLSAKELDALIAQAKKRRTTLSKRKPIALVRKKLSALARAEGYTVAELFGGAAGACTGEEGRDGRGALRAQVDQGLQARQGRAEVPQSAEHGGDLGRAAGSSRSGWPRRSPRAGSSKTS
jgi:hypothetical protein